MHQVVQFLDSEPWFSVRKHSLQTFRGFPELESITDIRSPNILGSHRVDIFYNTLYKIYSVDCLLRKIPKLQTKLLKKTGSKCHIIILFEVSICSDMMLILENCLCEVVFFFQDLISPHISFVTEKTHHR